MDMEARLGETSGEFATRSDDETADGSQTERRGIAGWLGQIEYRFGRVAGDIAALLITMLFIGLVVFFLLLLIG